ncbi:UDP-N-acetylmuramoylalanine--D-glutamate ligase [Anoxybacter fermentans]|uniref:UDP-N-acetylmuramoylalanine--D-glutamate ligase n=1 Tax=Anoxybacter fermentans TaxID=1323375 RepID=A0A3S9SXR6_9FIRM|nr:UDP-N-acetylmuramoyl-L-alanine--D-glutamate ligase [Anoxybacter fermentans]AZR73038.1 UDP-N-acetylmuramoylalanine--D-glutamate ligase [Anoxybacter fermentans]
MELKGKRIGIIGLGKRTGVVSAKVLVKMGAQVVVSDVKPAHKLKEELDLLRGISGISYDLGGHTEKVLDVDLILVSPGVPLEIPILKEAKKRGIEVIGEIELSYRLSKAPFIAITGTNGKTTTTSLLGQLLKTYPHRVFVGGNIGRPLIGEILNLKPNDLVVAEVSSFQLETVKEFHPEIALFLNFTQDHLDRHKSIEAYLKAKMNIFKNQTEEDYIILNADDQTLCKIASEVPSKIIWFSRQKKRLPGMYLDGNMMVCHMSEKPEELLLIDELKIRGDHNVENALAASAAAVLKGISLSDIRESLRNFKGQEHTLEYVLTHRGVQYYNDSKATNPDASMKALTAFHEPVVLIAGGLDRKLDFTEFIKLVVKKVKALILIGETREKLKKLALEYGFSGRIEITEELKEAVQLAQKFSEPGDVVLLSPACASWDMFESYAERGCLFKEYVRSL